MGPSATYPPFLLDLLLHTKRPDSSGQLAKLRLAMEVNQFQELLGWERRGIIVQLLDVQAYTSTATVRLFLHMLAAMAEFERSRIIERIREKANLRKSMGLTGNGMAPYGFKKATVHGKKQFVRDNWTRYLGGRIVEWRAKGFTFDAIYWHLIKKGCRQRNGKEISRSLIYKWFIGETQLKAKEAVKKSE
ncbi:MAG: recombinase family protein [Gemmataceae bacterium]